MGPKGKVALYHDQNIHLNSVSINIKKFYFVLFLLCLIYTHIVRLDIKGKLDRQTKYLTRPHRPTFVPDPSSLQLSLCMNIRFTEKRKILNVVYVDRVYL